MSVGAAAADFYLTTGRMPLNNPGNQAVAHRPFFDPQQIRELVAYVNALPVITKTFVFGPDHPDGGSRCARPSRPTQGLRHPVPGRCRASP